MAKCLQCGKEFTPKRKHKIFCSDSCRGAYHKQRNAKCEWCGSKIPESRMNGKKPAKYCSSRCMNSATKQRYIQRKNQGTPYERMQNQDFLNAVWSKVQDKKLGELK